MQQRGPKGPVLQSLHDRRQENVRNYRQNSSFTRRKPDWSVGRRLAGRGNDEATIRSSSFDNTVRLETGRLLWKRRCNHFDSRVFLWWWWIDDADEDVSQCYCCVVTSLSLLRCATFLIVCSVYRLFLHLVFNNVCICWLITSGCSETDFKLQLEHFNKELFTLVAWDPRGYGQSNPPSRDWPEHFFQRDASDAIALMEVWPGNKYLDDVC